MKGSANLRSSWAHKLGFCRWNAILASIYTFGPIGREGAVAGEVFQVGGVFDAAETRRPFGVAAPGRRRDPGFCDAGGGDGVVERVWLSGLGEELEYLWGKLEPV